jgi:glycosyltransferase involved in cell wall biosynthesis
VFPSAQLADPHRSATFEFFAQRFETTAASSFKEMRAALSKASVVHFHAATLVSWRPIGLVAAGASARAVFLTTHAPAYPPAPPRRRGRARMRVVVVLRGLLLSALTDGVFAPSEAAAEVVRRRFRPVRLRVSVALNGVPDFGVGHPAGSRSELRLAYVGRLSHDKRPFDVLETVRLLRDAGVAVRAEIAGTGPLEADVHTAVIETGLEASVTLHGFVSDPATIIKRCDVLVLPSISEANPLVAMEAAAAGRCTFARAGIGGIGEVLPDSAVFLNSSAPFASSAAAYLLREQTREELARRGVAARRAFEHQFSARTAAVFLCGMYSRALRGHVSSVATLPRLRVALHERIRHKRVVRDRGE